MAVPSPRMARLIPRILPRRRRVPDRFDSVPEPARSLRRACYTVAGGLDVTESKGVARPIHRRGGGRCARCGTCQRGAHFKRRRPGSAANTSSARALRRFAGNVSIFTLHGGTIGYLVNAGGVAVVDSEYAADAKIFLQGLNERVGQPSSGSTDQHASSRRSHGR